jgi:hypothetical protein
MAELTEEEVLLLRKRGTPESPPPYSGDTQLWAEDMDNYLRRRMQKLEDEIKKLSARVKALEPTPTETRNGSDGPTQGSSEGEAVPPAST